MYVKQRQENLPLKVFVMIKGFTIHNVLHSTSQFTTDIHQIQRPEHIYLQETLQMSHPEGTEIETKSQIYNTMAGGRGV